MLPSSSEVKKERGMPASRTDKNRKRIIGKEVQWFVRYFLMNFQ
jgi:hypothetical protein